MAKQINPLDEIKLCIAKNQNFLLSGGAGSGKTYSLIEVLNYIYEAKSGANVACITYTNVAVNEIRQRVPFGKLWVSTIHEFLWDSIKKYQPNLKSALLTLINEGQIKYSSDETLTAEHLNSYSIDYRDWSKLSEGVISHDEVIKLALKIFQDYPLIRKIVSDKWDYVLIDEYQDTFSSVIEIFLEHLKDTDLVFGFFGDSMQSIYENGGESLDTYVNNNSITKIIKEDNWRCSIKVIELINKLREDGLIQKQKTKDETECIGSINFVYSDSKSIEEIKQLNIFNEWDFNNTKKTKELYLTHKLISKGAGFEPLFAIYNKDPLLSFLKNSKNTDTDLSNHIDAKSSNFKTTYPEIWQIATKYSIEQLKDIFVSTDQLVEGGSEKKDGRGETKDRLQKHLVKIQNCIDAYKHGDINKFIELTDYPLKSIQDKKNLNTLMNEAIGEDHKDKTIGDMVDWASEKNIVFIDDKLNEFISKKGYVYERVRSLPYTIFENLYKYNQKVSPYSTQHGVKGAEYDDVLIVLDNGGWNSYNFEYMFSENGTESVINRTKKLFYVGCSRAKRNLVVYYLTPTEKILNKAKEFFGNDNVIDADK